MYRPQIKQVLIPIDFSDAARSAFAVGLQLAAQAGADVWVLYVSEPIRSFDFGRKRFVETKETIERVEDGVSRRIQEIWEEGGLEAVDRRRVQVLIRAGTAATEIIATAVEKNIDLLVMGKSGATTVAAMMGSTAEKVIRDAPCSVYLVHLPQDQRVG